MSWKYDEMGEALEQILELSKPGQQIDIYQAVDILSDIYVAAFKALKQMENE